MIDLENVEPRKRGKSVGSRVEAGAEDHQLFDTSIDRASERVVDYVRRHLPANIVLPTVIPRTIATADAFAAGQPVVLRSPADPASQAYINLATRLADRFL